MTKRKGEIYMNKPTIWTVGIALFLMLAVTFSVSAAPDTGGAIYKINPDGTQTLVENYNGTNQTMTATLDADGKLKIVREDGKPILGERSIYEITSDTTLPTAINTDNCGGGASKEVVAAQDIDALAAVTYYYSTATNYRIPATSYAYSGNINGYAGTEAGDNYCKWWAA